MTPHFGHVPWSTGIFDPNGAAEKAKAWARSAPGRVAEYSCDSWGGVTHWIVESTSYGTLRSREA